MGGLSPITVIAVRDGSDQKILLRYSPDDIIESGSCANWRIYRLSRFIKRKNKNG